MPNPRFTNIVPLGKITLVTPGTTVLLSVNSGPLAGQAGPITDYNNPPLSGQALRQIRLSADKANTGQMYILPRGYTAAANPGLIIAAIQPGESISLPQGFLGGESMQPENFVVDGDDAGSIYGCGFPG
jgi:hypothetical protein